jgi:hypothetical protein
MLILFHAALGQGGHLKALRSFILKIAFRFACISFSSAAALSSLQSYLFAIIRTHNAAGCFYLGLFWWITPR